MNERTLTINTPAALAAMMRQAQSDPEFREQLMKRGIPFGSLATALASLADVVAERNKYREALVRIGAPDFVYITDDDDMENPQLVMRMADARAVLK